MTPKHACVLLICALIPSLSHATCDNATFPLIQNQQAIGLSAPSYAECEQACCDTANCQVFQWCGDDASVTCTPKSSCFVVKSFNYQPGQTGWVGRSTQPPPAPFAFTNVHGDYMVLQQAPRRAQVYGTAPDLNDVVKIELRDAQDNMVASSEAIVNSDSRSQRR